MFVLMSQNANGNILLSDPHTFHDHIFLSPGFYCKEGSDSPQPIGKPYGDKCPSGMFCSRGSSVGELCPPTSYSNRTGMKGLCNLL